MPNPITPNQKILVALGAIVLCCQQIEKHFKFILPYTNTDDSRIGSILARHKKLSKKTLGELAGKFVSVADGDTEALENLLSTVVGKRNNLVHHFSEKYGHLISNGMHDEVLEDLRKQHKEAIELLQLLKPVSLAIVESISDSGILDADLLEGLNSLRT